MLIYKRNLILSAEKEGLFALLMIPGGVLQSLNYPSGLFIFPSVPSESKLSPALRENKKSRHVGINLNFGGERGYETSSPMY